VETCRVDLEAQPGVKGYIKAHLGALESDSLAVKVYFVI
jgi:hypothetical protein